MVTGAPRQARRHLLLGGLALAWSGLLAGCGLGRPPASPTPEPLRRIGVLDPNTRAAAPGIEAFVQELRGRGWVEGQNLTIDWREAQGRPDRYRALAAELVRQRPEVIVAMSSGFVEAARAASKTIPIVTAALPADPVALGWAASLAHPGGTVTGTVIHRELEAKRVELLKELVPGLTRVGIVWSGRPEPSVLQGVDIIEAAARELGVEPVSLEAATQAPDLDATFAQAAARGVGALVVYQSAVFGLRRARIVALATQARLPTIYPTRTYVVEGGLMSYAPNYNDLYRRTGRYVDEILRGAAAADLPFEQPRSFELAINPRVAASLGLAIPQSVSMQATEVIQ